MKNIFVLLLVAELLTAQKINVAGRFSMGFSNAATAIPATFVGLTTGDFINQHPTVSFGTARSWDSGGGSSPVDWADLNPSSGVFNFANFDNYITFIQAHSAEGIYTFGRTPSWASSNPTDSTCNYAPGECWPPSNLANWQAFVTAIVTHSAGRVKNWELWNEPQDPKFYSGSVATLVTMAQMARTIIKGIDPTARLIGPSATGLTGPAFLQSFLQAGGGQYLDVITFHGYSDASIAAENIIGVISGFKAVTQPGNVGGLPLWDTEADWAGYGELTLTTAQQMAFIPKYFLLQWSMGVSRFLWYSWDGSQWGGLESGGTPLPAATSFQQTYNWLVGQTMTKPCAADGNQTYSCTLTNAGWTGVVLWNSVTSENYTVPAGFTQYQDPYGNITTVTPGTVLSIANLPILLETGTLP